MIKKHVFSHKKICSTTKPASPMVIDAHRMSIYIPRAAKNISSKEKPAVST